MKKSHDLKIHPRYYKEVLSGEKTFEIRNNDRDFKAGDDIVLKEFADGFCGVKMIFHVSQSAEGALKNWPERTWRALAIDNQTTPDELKKVFSDYLSEGIRLLPLSDKCIGHDPIKGCPGHQ